MTSTLDERQQILAVMPLHAISTAHDSHLKSDIQNLEQALLLANPSAGAYSRVGYDSEDADVRAIGQLCVGDGVNGIANGW
jgi:hypothetical protein